jgi:hypothetical protein
MEILIGLAVVTVGFIVARLIAGAWSDWIIGAIFFGGLFCLALISVPLNRMESHAQISQFRAVGHTVTQARRNGPELESAAMQLKVAEMNQWLARQQYWNDTVFDIWIVDEVSELEPIE